MTEQTGEDHRREEIRELEEGPGGAPSNRESEERLAETERRKEQLQEAWRRRRTVPAPGRNRPNDKRGGRQG